MSRLRLALGAAGVLLAAFGVFRLLTQIPIDDLGILGGWLIGALIIHDGILSPLVIAVGYLLTRVPPRARRYLQGGLICGGLVTVVAIPMIYRQDSQPKSKAILQQNFGGNLTVLLALIAAASLCGYAVSVAGRSSARELRVDPPP